jgi:hypothetical protein
MLLIGLQWSCDSERSWAKYSQVELQPQQRRQLLPTQPEVFERRSEVDQQLTALCERRFPMYQMMTEIEAWLQLDSVYSQ